jgi:L-fuculose-phosphate aldolase
MIHQIEKQEIVRFGHLLYQKGFIAGSDGNLSIRLNDGNILITPSGLPKGFLDEDNMVVIDPKGKPILGSQKPSSEYLMHLYVYQKRPDIKACCHAHPPYSTAFSVVERVLPANILPEVVLFVGNIPLTEYGSPGTLEVPKTLEKYIAGNDAFMLRNHGILTIGRTLAEAYYRMETVEHYSKIIYIAESAGKLNFLDIDEVKRLEKMRESFKQGSKK